MVVSVIVIVAFGELVIRIEPTAMVVLVRIGRIREHISMASTSFVGSDILRIS